MGTAIRRSLASLLGIGLILAGRAMAQEAAPPKAAISLEPEVLPLAPGRESPPPVPSEAMPGDEGWRFGEHQPYVDSIFGNGAPGPGCETCAGGSACPPDWYLESDLKVMARSRPLRRPVPVSQELINSQANFFFPRIYPQNVGFDIAPGLQTTIGHYLGHDMEGRDRFLEFQYWGLLHWRGFKEYQGDRVVSNVQVGNPPVIVPFQFGDLFSQFPQSVGGFNRADRQGLFYQSDLNNFELNLRFSPRERFDRLVLYPDGHWRRECDPGFYCSYLVGARYMRMGDWTRFRSDGTFIRGDTGASANVFGDYEVRTRNDLLGVQVGGQLEYRDCRWTADVHTKCGPYLDVARARNNIVSHSVGIDPFAASDINDHFGNNRDVCAVDIEFGVGAAYKFRPNFIGRASYDFVWINGIALAPEQFQFSSTHPIDFFNTNGNVFYHGLTMGVELTW